MVFVYHIMVLPKRCYPITYNFFADLEYNRGKRNWAIVFSRTLLWSGTISPDLQSSGKFSSTIESYMRLWSNQQQNLSARDELALHAPSIQFDLWSQKAELYQTQVAKFFHIADKTSILSLKSRYFLLVFKVTNQFPELPLLLVNNDNHHAHGRNFHLAPTQSQLSHQRFRQHSSNS